jgi:hypothetical protein
MKKVCYMSYRQTAHWHVDTGEVFAIMHAADIANLVFAEFALVEKACAFEFDYYALHC